MSVREALLWAALGLYSWGCPIDVLFSEAARVRATGIAVSEADKVEAMMFFTGNLPSNGGRICDMPAPMVMWTLTQALDIAKRQS